MQNVAGFQMYRVKGLKASNGQNILLLCGTEVINDKGILKEGFKPSQTGRNGLEFYSTTALQLLLSMVNALLVIIEFLRVWYIFLSLN